jgi:hypothetical protein
MGFIEPIVRRRLSALSKIALKVAHDCVGQRDGVRVVFASRHGELRRTTDILRAIGAGEPVSPTAFSLSVMNAMTGVFSIARGDRSPASAISAGAETLGYALLEAHAQYASDPSSPVLGVYADEPADVAWGTIEEEVEGGALAILLDASGASDPGAGALECVLSGIPVTDAHAPSARPSTLSFPTQSQALLHCLATRAPVASSCTHANWQWSWHGNGL